jgi:hypothetical protein
MDPRTGKQPFFAADDVSWFGLAAGPVAWALDQGVSYAMVPWACEGHHHLPLHVVSLAALLLAAAGAVMSGRDWRHRRRAGSEEDDAAGRGHFLALLGLLMCLLFGLVVLMEGVAKFYFDPCQR